MSVDLKLKLLNYFFIALACFVVVMLGGVYVGSLTITEGSRWLTHTQGVVDKISVVKQDYDEALYLGQRKMLGEHFNGQIVEKRESAVAAVNALRETVADNPMQIENADYLKSSMERRFVLQDEQYLTMKRDAENRLIYEDDIVDKTVNLNNEINNLFSQMRNNESVLFVERYSRVVKWQKWLTGFAGVVLGLLLITIGGLYYLYRRLLKKIMLYSASLNDLAIESTQAGGSGTLPAKLQTFAEIMLHDKPPEKYAQ